jgi:hypothetical protein
MEPLSSAWVDRIWARLLVRYGVAWPAKWKGIDEQLVQRDWSLQLAGLSSEAIAHGLDNLPPDHPPTALQFRDLCRNRPSATPALTHDRPPPDPKRFAEALAPLTRRAGLTPAHVARETLDRLRHMRDTGQSMSAAQILFLDRAEQGLGAATVQELGDFRPIPPDALPPGMRSDR